MNFCTSVVYAHATTLWSVYIRGIAYLGCVDGTIGVSREYPDENYVSDARKTSLETRWLVDESDSKMIATAYQRNTQRTSVAHYM